MLPAGGDFRKGTEARRLPGRGEGSGPAGSGSDGPRAQAFGLRRFIRSCESRRFCSRSCPYCCFVTPSTPSATRTHASSLVRKVRRFRRQTVGEPNRKLVLRCRLLRRDSRSDGPPLRVDRGSTSNSPKASSKILSVRARANTRRFAAQGLMVILDSMVGAAAFLGPPEERRKVTG